VIALYSLLVFITGGFIGYHVSNIFYGLKIKKAIDLVNESRKQLWQSGGSKSNEEAMARIQTYINELEKMRSEKMRGDRVEH
jgi:hypothetical protein